MKGARKLLAGLLAAGVLQAQASAQGPETTADAIGTQSGQTLPVDTWDATVRVDFTQFEHVSDASAQRFAQERGSFDSVERALLATLAVDYGVTDDFQFGMDIGWYEGRNLREAELVNGAVQVAEGDPAGITDLWMTGKFRFFEDHGHLSLLGGIKFPVGDDDNRLDTGGEAKPSAQPGSGAFDGQAGLAYSRSLTPRLSLDASAAYTLRGTNDRFSVGDRVDAGVALAWRLTDPAEEFPDFTVFGEVFEVWLARDRSGGDRNDNSGGHRVFVTAGLRSRISPRFALSLAPSVPVYQGLNGHQPDTLFKVALSATVTF